MKTARVMILSVLLLAAACGGGTTQSAQVDEPAPPAEVAAPRTYRLNADADFDQSLQVSRFFPERLTVAAGDRVELVNRSLSAPHTYTLGVTADRSNGPAVITADGAFNPAVFGPCVLDAEPAVDVVSCGDDTVLRPFAGDGYWNTGLVPPGQEPGTTMLEIAPDAKPGTYDLVCLLHPFMNGQLEIVAAGGAVPSPQQAAEDAQGETDVALDEAAKIQTPRLAPENGRTVVVAGWGDKVAAVNRFEPAEVSVPVGGTVEWRALSPYEPHTVTFEPAFSSPEDPGTLAPGGVPPGGSYQGGFAHSGFFGPQPFPSDRASLVFDRPGTYEFVCILHPGMSGKVTVG